MSERLGWTVARRPVADFRGSIADMKSASYTFDHHFRQFGRVQVLGLKR